MRSMTGLVLVLAFAASLFGAGKTMEERFPVQFLILTSDSTGDGCYMWIQADNIQYFIKGDGFLHCTMGTPNTMVRGKYGYGLNPNMIQLAYGDKKVARYEIVRKKLLPK